MKQILCQYNHLRTYDEIILFRKQYELQYFEIRGCRTYFVLQSDSEREKQCKLCAAYNYHLIGIRLILGI